MDVPYIFLLFLLLILFFLNWYKKEWLYLYISPIIILLFIGLRAPVVGGDSIDYVRLFTGSKMGIYTYYDHVEALYRSYNFFMSNILYRQTPLFLLIHTFFSLAPFYLLVKKYSRSVPMSCLLFIIMSLYVYYMAAFRQILGMGILFYGMWYFLEKKKWKWQVFIASGVVGYFIHSSCFITFFVYLGCYFLRYKSKVVPYVAIVASALVGRVFHWFDLKAAMQLLAMNGISELERMNTYLTWSLSSDNDAGIIRLVASSAIAIFFFYMMSKRQACHWFSKILLVGIVVDNLFYGMKMLDRLLLPFMMFAVICYTWVFNLKYIFAKSFEKGLYKFLLILAIAYMSQSYVKQNTNWDKEDSMLLHPYYFFWQDYRDHPAHRLR